MRSSVLAPSFSSLAHNTADRIGLFRRLHRRFLAQTPLENRKHSAEDSLFSVVSPILALPEPLWSNWTTGNESVRVRPKQGRWQHSATKDSKILLQTTTELCEYYLNFSISFAELAGKSARVLLHPIGHFIDYLQDILSGQSPPHNPMDPSIPTSQNPTAMSPFNNAEINAPPAVGVAPTSSSTSIAAPSPLPAAAAPPQQLPAPVLPSTAASSTGTKSEGTNGAVADPIDTTTDSTSKDDKNGDKKTNKKVATASSLGKSYLDIIQEAIIAMDDRTGSSLARIKKWIASNYGSLMDNPQFNGRLNKAIRNGVNSKKLLKIRASYKVSQTTGSRKRKSTDTAKEQAEFEKKLEGVAPEVAERMRKAKEEEDRKREKKDNEIAERLRKRRFPMEDTKLHAEDKELKVRPPSKVKARPTLPYFWNIPLPLDHPDRKGKTPGLVLTYSKADALDVDSRGLVPDLLQVYHFFRGDVHFDFNFDDERGRNNSGIVPEFTLRHLIFAVNQIINGNARKTRLVPPLLVHLLVTSLQILLSGIGSYSSPNEAHMYAELHKYLGPALTPVSWADICHLYMDAMERYYTSDASLEPNVLETEPLAVEYLFGKTDTMVTTKIEGSRGYLGHSNGSLYKAHHKLAKMDPWNLTAEELMAVLRALTEDILALHPEIMDHREEQLQELAKNKRNADAKFRKVRLAYEGPPKKESGNSSNGKDNSFVPTTSKRQLDAAKREQEQASQEYRDGRRDLVARTMPIGQDRNFNEVYSFDNDPEFLLVEERRPATNASALKIPAAFLPGKRSWHAIETTSLLDDFAASLDVRGKRENDLYNKLVGEDSPRPFLIDDVALVAETEAKQKERAKLESKLEAVKKKCQIAEEARRSSRQGLQPEEELVQLEDELARLSEEEKNKPLSTVEIDVDDSTGIYALAKFEKAKQRDKRRKKDRNDNLTPQSLPLLHCSQIRVSSDDKGTGLVGMMVKSLQDLEQHCNNLVPWMRNDISRDTWLSRMEECVKAWNALSFKSSDTTMSTTTTRSTPSVGSPIMNGASNQSANPSSEGPMPNCNANQSAPVIMGVLRKLLLDLEERVADITNLALATRDADLADDNMSTQSEQESPVNNGVSSNSWKKHVKTIQNIPAKRYARIRELLILAIADARKAHLPTIVAQLRAALQKYRPSASSTECKDAAVQVLENNGGYDPDEEDLVEDKDEPLAKEDLPSVISAEAVTLRSSLDGSDESRREDWVEAVRTTRTLSRLAGLSAGFVSDAMERVTKLEHEHSALQKALVEWKKPPKAAKPKGRGAPPKIFKDPTEVWADVLIMDDICMAKAADYPWWPAKKCTAKDSLIREDLKEVNRTLVAFIGEMGAIRVVPSSSIKPFDGKNVEEEGVEYKKEMKSQLDDCMAMARRLIRGIQKQSNGDAPRQVETK